MSALEDRLLAQIAAAVQGWRVLRATGDMVEDGRALQVLEAALRQPCPPEVAVV